MIWCNTTTAHVYVSDRVLQVSHKTKGAGKHACKKSDPQFSKFCLKTLIEIFASGASSKRNSEQSECYFQHLTYKWVSSHAEMTVVDMMQTSHPLKWANLRTTPPLWDNALYYINYSYSQIAINYLSLKNTLLILALGVFSYENNVDYACHVQNHITQAPVTVLTKWPAAT